MGYIRNLFLTFLLLAIGAGAGNASIFAGDTSMHCAHMVLSQPAASPIDKPMSDHPPCHEERRSADARHDHACPSALLCSSSATSIPVIAASDMTFVSQQIRYDAARAPQMISAIPAPAGPPPKA